MRAVFILVLLFAFVADARAVGYQTNANIGYDSADSTAKRGSAMFLQGQLATVAKVFRFHSVFTLLSGSGYREGEAAVGISIYPVSQFVSERAAIHPFITGMGTAGIGSLNNKSRLDTGYGYGVGLDVKFTRTFGWTLSIQQHQATEKSTRYSLGLFWMRGL